MPIQALSANNLIVPLFALALAFPWRASLLPVLRAHRVLLSAIGLLYLWMWVAAADSLAPAISARYAAKCMGYLLILGAFLLWLHGRPAARLTALRTVYALCVALAALGVVEYGFPSFPFVPLRGTLVTYPRVSSLFVWPNQFAVVMAITVGLGAGLRHAGAIRPLAFHAPLVLLLTALVLSGSRNGWFVLGAVLVVLAAVRATPPRQVAVIMAAFALMVLSQPLTRARVGLVEAYRSPAADTPVESRTRPHMITPRETLTPRLQLWSAALELIRENPITGVGPEVFANTVGARILGETGFNTHNLLLNVATELGLVGLALFLVCLWALFRAGNPRDWMTSVPLLGLGLGQIFDCFNYDYSFMTFSLFFVAAYVSAPREGVGGAPRRGPDASPSDARLRAGHCRGRG